MYTEFRENPSRRTNFQFYPQHLYKGAIALRSLNLESALEERMVLSYSISQTQLLTNIGGM